MTAIPRQVWLPQQFADFAGLPAGLQYTRWDGVSAFPTDPAVVEFYVPPLVQDIGVISKPLTDMTRLRVVQALSSGTDELRSELERLPRHITLCSARGVNARSTAELALTLILSSLRGIPDFVRAQGDGVWRPAVRASLDGQHVVLVGYGAIGSAVEDLLTPFRCRVTRVARTDRATPRGPVHSVQRLADLVTQADVVVVATPLTPDTRGLIDATVLARMKNGALLVNVSRGAVVDTAALVEEARSGRLRVAVDVTDPDPLPEGHPLWSVPDVLITPHVGAFTHSLWPRLEELIRAQLARFAAGEELVNVVAR
ncbi:2-hydroxyacid dehydrogenase [Streptomyces longwoodensis]|uniref:2-hydroxyacid dehydrogenase n=1 Tax=Streptomyces longwoodensis TaxID=68231 RepID=UPI00340F48E7